MTEMRVGSSFDGKWQDGLKADRNDDRIVTRSYNEIVPLASLEDTRRTRHPRRNTRGAGLEAQGNLKVSYSLLIKCELRL